MASACFLALACILPATSGMIVFWVIACGAHIADTLFHELGHTVFSWLFGAPAIPMIFTLYGADQAGGMTLTYERSWLVQWGAYAGMGYGCFWAYRNWFRVFVPAVVFCAVVVGVSLSRHYEIVIDYMGHGGAIAVGGFFLFRAWVYMDARNGYERWLNAFFGFFLTLDNVYFAYNIAFDAWARDDYTGHVAFGLTHNDFQKIAEEMAGWSTRGVAVFTLGYAGVVIVGAFVLAGLLRDNFYE